MRENIEHGRKGKHCHNCRYLEWMEGEAGDPAGWICNKREYENVDAENWHYAQLDIEEYRFKGKRCHESKVPNVKVTGA